MEASLTTGAMALIPIIMALTSLTKNYVDSKWSPAIVLALSLAAAFSLVPLDTVPHTTLEGILMALAAAGLYSGGKATGKALATELAG